jgi:hypothetical protein
VSSMVTSGSFILIPQSLGRPVSREVGWEGALDPGRFSDYSPSRNDPGVSMPPRSDGPVAATAAPDAVPVPVPVPDAAPVADAEPIAVAE